MNLGTFRVAGKNPAKGELEKGNRGFRRESKILFSFLEPSGSQNRNRIRGPDLTPGILAWRDRA